MHIDLTLPVDYYGMRDSHVHAARLKSRIESCVGVARSAVVLLLVRSDMRHSRLVDGSLRSFRDFGAPCVRGVPASWLVRAAMKTLLDET